MKHNYINLILHFNNINLFDDYYSDTIVIGVQTEEQENVKLFVNMLDDRYTESFYLQETIDDICTIDIDLYTLLVCLIYKKYRDTMKIDIKKLNVDKINEMIQYVTDRAV